MKWTVMINAVDAAGEPIWGYYHEEVFVGGEDAQENALRMAARMLSRVDEGRAAIVEQADVDLPLIEKEQERTEEDTRASRLRQRRRPHGA